MSDTTLCELVGLGLVAFAMWYSICLVIDFIVAVIQIIKEGVRGHDNK